ncbi:MAG TPA: Hsp20/alpha crystallin family protein [Polyangiaceae bacterium]|nr:Hsp20/alpha crystallin family protein [Polyangiaceae bacterium]
MANVAVQREKAPQVTAPVRRHPSWEPFRTIRELMRWEPFGETAPAWMERIQTFMPDFEVKETQNAFVFKADMPGIEEKNLDVKLTNNRLTVSGKRETEKVEQAETYYTTERSYGSFTRSFVLPEGFDGEKVAAELEKGVLTITIAKKPEAVAQKVNVTSK